MNRDAMIEALARAISHSLHNSPKHSDAAAAVLDLCGPEPLVWVDDEDGCLRCGPYDIWAFDSGITLLYWQVVYADDFPTLEAAKAAAQSHATAAHWANTPIGKLVGVV